MNRKYYGGTISSVFSIDQLDDEDVACHKSYPDEILHYLHYFDYRYIRFICHPGIGKFLQNRLISMGLLNHNCRHRDTFINKILLVFGKIQAGHLLRS